METLSLLAALILLLPAATPQGRAANTKGPEDSAIKLNARLVNLNIKVMDQSGKPLAKLRREDFTILEDNVPQQITYFEPVTAPVKLILLLDLSGSIGSKL